MFEAMFGVGQAQQANTKVGGIRGGNLFVDERGNFFQRELRSIDDVRLEAKEGPTGSTVLQAFGDRYEASVALPLGLWEISIVETDPEASTLTVICVPCDSEAEDDEWRALNVGVKRLLRVERPFVLPRDADMMVAAVSISQEGNLLSVCTPKSLSLGSLEGASGGITAEPGKFDIGADGPRHRAEDERKATRRYQQKGAKLPSTLESDVASKENRLHGWNHAGEVL